MFKSFLCLLATAVFCGGCVNVHTEEKIVAARPCAGDTQGAKVLRHVVLMKFKDGTSADKIREMERAFAALPGQIPAICDFEWGANVSVENRSEGFTHCFLVTFKDEAARAEYLPHPAHKQFGSMLSGCLDKVLVVDYWTNR